jgi:hypothetical protein
MYSGALEAGWGKSGGKDIKPGPRLAQNTLEILSGLGATYLRKRGFNDLRRLDPNLT